MTERLEGSSPEVVALADGSFLVLFTALRRDPLEEIGVGGRRYGPDGTLLTEFLLPVTDPNKEFIWEIVARPMSDNTVVVAVEPQVLHPEISGLIRLLRVSPQGLLMSRAVDVAPGGGYHSDPSVLPGVGGDFTLTWDSNPSNLVGEGHLAAQRFARDGQALTPPVGRDEATRSPAARRSRPGLSRGLDRDEP